MNLDAELAALPEGWRTGGVSLDLLAATFPPESAPAASPLAGSVLHRVRLAVRPAGTTLTGGPGYVVSHPEFLVRLGWVPVVELRTIFHMRPPDGAAVDEAGPEILVPRPMDDALLEVAYERAALGVAWAGHAWHWPASFAPAAVSREWEPEQLEIWDGRDRWGRPTGGMMKIPAGWQDASTLARFHIGIVGVWTATITWKPEPTLSEVSGREMLPSRIIEWHRPAGPC